MTERLIKLPDIGEGVAEAEIIELHVKIGDIVHEDQVLAAVMTDKATVEIPSPVRGKVRWIGVNVGEIVAVGSELVVLQTSEGNGAADSPEASCSVPAQGIPPAPQRAFKKEGKVKTDLPAPRPDDRIGILEGREPAPGSTAMASYERPLASPAVRKRARELNIDLRMMRGSGPAGRITHEDLEQTSPMAANPSRKADGARDPSVEQIRITGLRRIIAQRMHEAKRRIPHYTLVEEVDVTSLEALRGDINSEDHSERPKLTVLPFVMLAMVVALREHSQINARFDDTTETLDQYGGVHIGIATHTANGLMVPVVRHVEALSVWDCAREISRLAEAASGGSISRDELQGSTITITSLGAFGGLMTTPVINSPEVAIVGINKIAIRPVWEGDAFQPKKMMNLSCSFDHRIVDGWIAAQFVRRLRLLLENPAKIFLEA